MAIMIDWEKIAHKFLKCAVWAYNKSDRPEATKKAYKEFVRNAESDAVFKVGYDESEVKIQTVRLARRMDPAAALNEATNRAIEIRKQQGLDEGPRLTRQQLAALEFQKDYLRRVASQ